MFKTGFTLKNLLSFLPVHLFLFAYVAAAALVLFCSVCLLAV